MTAPAAARPNAPLFIRSHCDLPPPVILLGMHRSGTSILAQMLQTCGLFIGRTVDGHFESPYFRRINDEFLSRCDSSWTNIEGYVEDRTDPSFRAECREWAEARLDRTFGTRFLGLRHRTPLLSPIRQWGWKDPRTCLTMDVWNEIFPEARVLHLTRHPLDVAISLKRRQEQRLAQGKKSLPQNADLSHGLKLWEQHVGDARRLCSAGSRYHELRFEDLLRDPGAHLETMVRFCGLSPNRAALGSAAALLDGTRTRRFDEDEGYRIWRDTIAGMPLARDLGYE